MNKDTLTISVLDMLHDAASNHIPDSEKIVAALSEVGKEIDRCKVNNEPTFVLERLYEEILWLKTEVAL